MTRLLLSLGFLLCLDPTWVVSPAYAAKGKKKKADRTWISSLNYGNHCGSGHSSDKPPIDRVDGLCETHDRCCKEKAVAGVSVCPCACDRALLGSSKSMRRKAKKLRLTKKQRAMLKTIITVFSDFACYCKPQKICEDKARCGRKNGLRPYCKWQQKCFTSEIRGKGGKCRAPKCRKAKLCKTFMGKKFCKRGTRCKVPR